MHHNLWLLLIIVVFMLVQPCCNRQDEAETIYLKILEIDGNDYSAMYALTILYVQQQNRKEAEIRARHLLRLNPDSAEAIKIVEYIRQNRDK